MNTALIFALLAVAISLATVAIVMRAEQARRNASADGGSGAHASGDSGSSDCGGDGGGCD